MAAISRDKARIFRITHQDNLPWLLRHGVTCRTSGDFDPDYRNIGNTELIGKRAARVVPIPPGGTLSDYVPFYFTSRTPMLLNIKTGRNVSAVPMQDLVVIVSSLPRLVARNIPFVFTDRHAYLVTARFFSELADLDRIDWDILRRSDFRYDPNDLGKMDRYQAEALVHQRLPADALTGIICHDAARRVRLEELVRAAGHSTPVVARPDYYV